MNELLTWLLVGWDGISCDRLSREEAFVELAIIEAQLMDEDWSYGDREFHMKTKHFERTSIEFEDILTREDDFVVVRGIAGIGKTSMVDSYVLKWAKHELLNGKKNSHQIDFLFKLTCRNINTFTDISTAEQLLRTEYGNVLKDVEFKEVEDVSHRILILVDGADELQSLHQISNTKTRQIPRLVKSVYELIDIRSNFLTAHKTIIAARPEACQIIDATFKSTVKIKMIEICGFNPRSVCVYIDNYFGKNIITAQIVKQKIEESENLTVMASIPVYTWVICAVFNEDINIESPRTTTHLCTYACLLFIRNHFNQTLRNLFPSNCSLLEVINNANVVQVILGLAKLSKSTLKYKKVVFSDTDLGSIKSPIALQTTGFIEKNQRKNVYQFRHLVLQEYLTALYLYLKSSNLTKVLHENKYRSCIPIIAGFSGIDNVENTDQIALFIKNLKDHISCTGKWKLHLPRTPAKTIVLNWLKSMIQNLVVRDKLILADNSRSLLGAFYEYQGDIPGNLVDRLMHTPIVFKNIMFHHDIRNAMYFLRKLKSTNISDIDITNFTQKKFPVNFIDMLKLYFAKKENNSLCLKGGEVMKIYSDRMEDHLAIQFAWGDNKLDTHDEFLLAAISLADTITLHYSLDITYPHVRNLLNSNDGNKDVKYQHNIEINHTPNQLKMFSDSILFDRKRDKPNTELDLSRCNLTDDHIESLQPCIAYLDNLIIKGNTKMSSQSMRFISDAVMEAIKINNTSNLKLIDLSRCNLTDEHIEGLQPCIAYIENLIINANGKMSSQAMRFISDAVMEATKINNTSNLKLIDLSHCNIRDEHIKSLQPCIPYLENLIIHGNAEMSSQSMRFISDAVMEEIKINNTSNLKLIDLAWCDITDTHIESLQPCIPYLENLIINANGKMSSQSMRFISDAVMEAIKINNTSKLKLIDLAGCKMTDKHIERLQPCIPYLENLIFTDYLLSSKSKQLIKTALRKGLQLK